MQTSQRTSQHIFFAFWFLLIFPSKSIVAQAVSTKIDSLETILNQVSSKTVQMNIKATLMVALQNLSPEKSEKYAQDVITLSQELHSPRQEALGYNHLGLLAWGKGNLSESLTYIETGQELAKKHHYYEVEALILVDLGNIHANLNNYLLALENFHNALALFKKSRDRKSKIRCLNNIGWQYVLLGNYDSAKYYFENALPIAHQENSRFLAYLYDNLGETYTRQRQYKKAIPYLQNGLKYAKKFNNKRIELVVYRVLGEIHFEQQEVDSAEHFAQKSLELAFELGAKQKIYQAYKVLSHVSFYRKNFEKAYEYQKAYIVYRDSLLNQDTQNKIKYHDYERQQSELALLKMFHEKKITQRNTIIGVVLLGLIVAIVIGILVNRNHKKLQTSYNTLQKANFQISEQNKEIIAQKNILAQTLVDLKNTQGQLVRVEQRASLGLLTASVAHEINNPLNFMVVGVENLQDIFEEMWEIIETYEDLRLQKGLEISPEFQEQITDLRAELEFDEKTQKMSFEVFQDIHQGAERIIKVVKSLQTFVRLGENHQVQLTDLHKNIHAVLVLLGNRFVGKIKLNTDFAPHLSEVCCFPDEMNQVFVNLLINAEDALDGKGEISLKTSENEYFIMISIRDNGKGIPPKIQPKIFNPLFTTKTNWQNSGLGLTTTKHIIEAHQGKIECISEVGKGTEFIIYLPKKR